MRADLRGLAWPKLISGTLVKRYKRFLADVKLNNNYDTAIDLEKIVLNKKIPYRL